MKKRLIFDVLAQVEVDVDVPDDQADLDEEIEGVADDCKDAMENHIDISAGPFNWALSVQSISLSQAVDA